MSRWRTVSTCHCPPSKSKNAHQIVRRPNLSGRSAGLACAGDLDVLRICRGEAGAYCQSTQRASRNPDGCRKRAWLPMAPSGAHGRARCNRRPISNKQPESAPQFHKSIPVSARCYGLCLRANVRPTATYKKPALDRNRVRPCIGVGCWSLGERERRARGRATDALRMVCAYCDVQVRGDRRREGPHSQRPLSYFAPLLILARLTAKRTTPPWRREGGGSQPRPRGLTAIHSSGPAMCCVLRVACCERKLVWADHREAPETDNLIDD